jgi:hypothetical protein
MAQSKSMEKRLAAQKAKPAKPGKKKTQKDSTPVMDLICPQCKGRYHETTEHFDPVRLPNTSMARLKEPYRSWGWEDFNTPPPGDGPGHMNCPNCGAAYVSPKMGLIVRPQKKGDKQDGRTEEK